jgi:flagellar biosynthesis/type III secretory pathway protein FliH
MPNLPPKGPLEKFGFSHDFFELNVAPPNPRAPPPAVVVQQAHDDGYAAGYAAGETTGRNTAQQQAALEIAELKNQLLGLTNHFSTAQEEYTTGLTVSALTVIRQALHRLIGHAAANYPDQILEHFLHKLLPTLRTGEEVTLRVNPAARQYHDKLGLPQASIGGRPMHIVSDGALGPADCVLEWSRGGLESKIAQILADLDEALSHAGADIQQATPPPPTQPSRSFNPAGSPPPASFQPTPPASAPAPPAETQLADQLLGTDDLIDALK